MQHSYLLVDLFGGVFEVFSIQFVKKMDKWMILVLK